MTSGEKIKRLRKFLGMTQADFAHKLSISNGHISDIERGHKPSQHLIELLKVVYNVSESWWETGEGEMFNKKAEVIQTAMPLFIGGCKIPIISYTQAGVDGFFSDSHPTGCGFGEIDRPADVRDPHAYALIVKGDSMSPRFEQGDVVVVSPSMGVQIGDYAVVRLVDGSVTLKKIQQKNGVFILGSTNPEYESIEVEKHDVVFMHRVVWIRPRG